MFFRRRCVFSKLIIAVAYTAKIPCITHIHYINSTQSRSNEISRLSNATFAYNNFFGKFLNVHAFTRFLK